MAMCIDLAEHNREAWNREVEKGNIWTLPVDEKTVEEARRGRFSLVLTPTVPVPRDWFGEIAGRDILCLASAGGQQAPVLAAARARVTVFDNCPGQLDKDRMVARREKLDLSFVQGDMRNLSVFEDSSFDLIFHPVSNCFVDNVEAVWRECYRVLRPGGRLLSGFCNPLIYIFDMDAWDNRRELSVKHRIPYSDLEQLSKEELELRIAQKETLEFGHSLESQIGGQIRAGFFIRGFYEDTAGGDLLDSHIKTFISTLAVKG